MQFQVPQFIEIEDKIFGSLTIKQFVYIFGGGGFGYVAFTYLPKIIGPLVGLILFAFGLALAFVSINRKPFVHIVQSYVKYIFNSRLYVWKRKPPKKAAGEKSASAAVPTAEVPNLSDSKLKDLAWSLDIHGTLTTGQHDPPKQ